LKIIFLDIDGVLNSVASIIALYDDKPVRNEEGFDHVSVGLLKRLCKTTDAKIVISSTWRKLYTYEEFLEIFSRKGWQDFPMIGTTPVNQSHGLCRGHEIKDWLDANEVETYIILDDDSDMLPEQNGNFIHCSNVEGFRLKHYCKALRLLGCPDEQLESQVNFVRKTTIGEV